MSQLNPNPLTGPSLQDQPLTPEQQAAYANYQAMQKLKQQHAQAIAGYQETPGFWSTAASYLNPIPALQEWWHRPEEYKKALDALHVSMKQGPLTPEEQAIVDAGMNANVGYGPDGSWGQGYAPGVAAGVHASDGNYRQAAGDLVGGYVAPAAIGEGIGAAWRNRIPIKDALTGHETRQVSLGLELGGGAPIKQELPKDFRAISYENADQFADQVANATGVQQANRYHGLGAYLADQEPSVQMVVRGKKGTVDNFSNGLGYGSQQTEIISTGPGKKNASVVSLVQKDGDALGTDAARKTLHDALMEAAPDGMANGFSPYVDEQGRPGMRFVNFDGKWSTSQIRQFVQKAKEIAKQQGYNIDTNVGETNLRRLKNDWTTDPSGSGYLEPLQRSLGAEHVEGLREAGAALQERLKAQPTGVLGGASHGEGEAGSVQALDSTPIPGPRSTSTGKLPFMDMPVDELKKKLINPSNPYEERAMFYNPDGGKDAYGTVMATQDAVNTMRDLGAHFWPEDYREGRLTHGFALPGPQSERLKNSMYNGFANGQWQNHMGKPLPKYFQDPSFQDRILGPLYEGLQHSPNLTVAAINPVGGEYHPGQIAYHEGLHRGQFKLDPVSRQMPNLLPPQYTGKLTSKEAAPNLHQLGNALAHGYPAAHIPAEMGTWLGADMWHGLVPSEVAEGAAKEYMDGLYMRHGEAADPLVRELLRSFRLQFPNSKKFRKGGIVTGMEQQGTGITGNEEDPLYMALRSGDREAFSREWQKIFGTHEDYRKQYPHLYPSETSSD